MTKEIPERLKKTKATQIKKYGGLEGYKAEMRRRRSLMKSKTGFAIMSKDKIKQAQLKSAQTRTTNAKNQVRTEA
jgi:hypothetical protein